MLGAVLVSAAPALLQAVELRLDTTAISEAIALGNSPVARDRARFHEAYRITLSRPPFDFVEVVTPFRRVVLATEARARAGDHRFGQREALEVLAGAPAQIGVYVEVTFHPLNTYVLVPLYQVSLEFGAGSGRLEARSIDRQPRYGPRVDGGPAPFAPGAVAGGAVPGRSQPMLGATIVAVFDGEVLGSRCDEGCDLVVTENQQELVRGRLTLGRLR